MNESTENTAGDENLGTAVGGDAMEIDEARE